LALWAEGGKPIKNNTLIGWPRTGLPMTGVSKATKMHHFGRQGAEIVAIKRIVVIDHDVTAMTPLNISWRYGTLRHALHKGSGRFLVATAQQG
jgi:hypothetical protein